MKKVFSFLLIFIMILFFINSPKVYANTMFTDAVSGGKTFLDKADEVLSSEQQETLKSTSSSVYNTLLLISFVVVAIVGIALGIKFMMAGVEEKADVKQALVVWAIGAGVAYGAFGIWRVLVTFLNTI